MQLDTGSTRAQKSLARLPYCGVRTATAEKTSDVAWPLPAQLLKHNLQAVIRRCGATTACGAHNLLEGRGKNCGMPLGFPDSLYNG